MSSPSIWKRAASSIAATSSGLTGERSFDGPDREPDRRRFGIGVAPAAQGGRIALGRLAPQERRRQRPVRLGDRRRLQRIAREMLADEGRRRLAGGELRMLQQADQEMPVGGRAQHDGVAQGLHQPRARFLAVGAVGDHLGDHRIVEGRDREPVFHAVIDADARAGRRPPDIDAPGLRQEAGIGVLGIEADFDGVARELHLLLGERQLLAGRDLELPGDEVQAGDRLGHGMLDLQPRVHLEEVEGAVGRRAGTRPCRRRGSRWCARRRRRRPPCDCAGRRSRRARALPRSPSDGGAAPSSRARRDG